MLICVKFTVADGSIWKDASLSSWSPFARLNSELIRSRFSSRQTSSAQHKVRIAFDAIPNNELCEPLTNQSA